MAWPTSKPNSNAFDAASDKISNARPELKTMSDAVNNMVDFIQPSGITNNQVLIYNSISGAMEPGSATAPSASADSNGVFYGATLEIYATGTGSSTPSAGQTIVVIHSGGATAGYSYTIDLQNYVGNQKVIVIHDGTALGIGGVNTSVQYNGTTIDTLSGSPFNTATIGEFTIIDTATADSAGNNTYISYRTTTSDGNTTQDIVKVT